MDINCPRCNSKMEILGTQKIESRTVEVKAKCSNCGLYIELTIEIPEKETRLLKKTIHTIKEVPKESPKLIHDLIEAIDFLSFFYLSKRGEKPPTVSLKVDELTKVGFPKQIADYFRDRLKSLGIDGLYSHQVEAIRSILSGYNVLLTAPTGTGKTEAFALPSFSKAFELRKRGELPPHVLIVYPTKALARDQLKKLRIYAEGMGLKLDVLDGDTSSYKRSKIVRDPPEVLITNFDMIHYHLARSTKLSFLFKRAKIIIMDEAHTYTGAFGTHVYYILKRLQRLCDHPQPQLVMSSATIHNAEEFAKYFLSNGREIKIIRGEGRRTPLFLLFSYPLESIYSAISKLLIYAIEKKVKSLAFLNTRRGAEYVLYLLNKFSKMRPKIRGLYDIHRAGLPKKTRVEIEESFKSGKKLSLVATPTLEMGIDIGDLDLVVSEITPIDNFIQRSGRAGRRGNPGVAVLVLRNDDPISEYYRKHPDEYLSDITLKYIEPSNEYIAESHLYLMAVEKPIKSEEIDKLVPNKSIVENLMKRGSIVRVGDKLYANKAHFPRYFNTNIRGADKTVRVYFDDKIIDEREAVIAVRELHPEALYIVRGKKFIVKKLDLEKLIAEVEEADKEFENYYTKPLYSYSAEPLRIVSKRETLGTTVFYGLFKMKAYVYGYLLFREGIDKPVDERLLANPVTYTYKTFGIVFKAPEVDYPSEEKIAGTYHAAEHILIEGTNKVTGGGSDDLGGISFGTTGIIVIYDGTPGGNGVSQLLFKRFERAVERARDMLRDCKTDDDEKFNKCVYSYRCGNNNRPLYARGALEVLEAMMAEKVVVGSVESPEILKLLDKGYV